MALSDTTLVLLFVMGALLALLLIVALRKPPAAPAPQGVLTSAWRLSELKAPLVVGHDIGALSIPPSTVVIASGLVDPEVQAAADVRQTDATRAAFALDEHRAIMFIGAAEEGQMAFVTSEKALIDRLHAEGRRMIDRSKPYVETTPISELGERHGVAVETVGFVQEVVPYRERFLLRLEDGGHIVGVLTGVDQGWTEQRVRVSGQLVRDDGGYTVIEAAEIQTI